MKTIVNAFGHKEQIKKFSKGRNNIKDLYPSEKKFFIDIAKKSKTFVDFGCAAGNFIKILNKVSKIKNYIGIDISREMISTAKILHPNFNFKKFNGEEIKLNSKYDLVYSFGTLIYCKNYKDIINDLINCSKKYINFDVRLVFDKNKKDNDQSFQIISKKKLPYIIINFNEFLEFLLKTTGHNYMIKLYGYRHKVANSVRSKYKKTYMVSVLIDKTKKFSINIDIKK